MVLCMARPTRRKGSVNCQFRKRVPADILAKAQGRRVTFRLPSSDGNGPIIVSVTIGREISFSLRTSDAGCAKERQAAALLQFERWCDNFRTGPKSLTHKEQVALAGVLYSAFAKGLEDDPGPAVLWERVREMNEFAISGESHALGIYANQEQRQAAALNDRFGPMVDALLQTEGLFIDDASRAGVIRVTSRALTDAAEKLKRDAEGDYRPDRVAARFPSWSSAPIVEG
jgi:hypothetical protein